jgi:hypothetical protein
VLQNLYGISHPNQVEDFFNEMCNLCFGKLKMVFIDHGIQAAMTLPMGCELQKIRRSQIEEVLPLLAQFEFLGNGFLFYAFVSCAIHDLDRVQAIPADFSILDDNKGDVDFF